MEFSRIKSLFDSDYRNIFYTKFDKFEARGFKNLPISFFQDKYDLHNFTWREACFIEQRAGHFVKKDSHLFDFSTLHFNAIRM